MDKLVDFVKATRFTKALTPEMLEVASSVAESILADESLPKNWRKEVSTALKGAVDGIPGQLPVVRALVSQRVTLVYWE